MAKSHAKSFFSRAEQYTELYMNQVKNSLQFVQESEVLHDFMVHPEHENQILLRSMIQQVTQSLPAIYQLTILDSNGSSQIDFVKAGPPNVKIDILSAYEIPQFPDFHLLRKARPTDIWFSGLTKLADSRGELKLTLQVGLPVFVNSRFAGVVVAKLDTGNLLRQLLKPSGAENYLLDKYGHVLYSNQVPVDAWESENQPSVTTPRPKSLVMWRAIGFSTFHLSHIIPGPDQLTLAYRVQDAFEQELGMPRSTYAILLIAIVVVFSVPIGALIAWKTARRQIMLNRLSVESQESLDIIDQYVPVVLTDKQGCIQRCNDAFSQLTGYAKTELLGRSYGMLSHPLAANQLQFSMFRTLLPGRQWQGELHSQTRGGDELWLHTSIIPRFDEMQNLTGYMAIFTDRTDRKLVERMAERDPLTGIYNRMKIDELLRGYLAQSDKSGREFAIILIDVDYFKAINDEHGHLVGDNTLIEMTHLLQHSLNQPNEIGRWGGEEFIVICPQSDYMEAYHLANKLCTIVSEHHFRHTGQVTISLGVSSSIGKDSVAELLNEADQGLYEAKDRGRCQVVGRFSVEKQSSLPSEQEEAEEPGAEMLS
ncbi:sensor domain-containing diguanylate cyclase [Vibrio mangrovi]|nr:diguanylate cyclase [Vibrio mangrovi]MDW6003948.1 diguanylate cyclase [Vibrio mangrovi]